VVFEYAGPVDRNKLDELVEIAEARSLAVRDGVSIRKRLFNVLVEGLENIHRHTPIEFADSGFALLERRDGHYRVVIGNTLPAASAALLSHRVEVLNDMDEADLRECFLKLLANEGRTERGGAGLGLLTMARKSARPMVVHSTAHDDATVHLALELSLDFA
jgi:hypothetical protein